MAGFQVIAEVVASRPTVFPGSTPMFGQHRENLCEHLLLARLFLDPAHSRCAELTCPALNCLLAPRAARQGGRRCGGRPPATGFLSGYGLTITVSDVEFFAVMKPAGVSAVITVVPSLRALNGMTADEEPPPMLKDEPMIPTAGSLFFSSTVAETP